MGEREHTLLRKISRLQRIVELSRTGSGPTPARASERSLEIAQAARSSYDDIADMYHSLWANWYLPAALPALEKLFFSQLCSGGRVLDLCCGSGHVTRELVERGYAVTGVDASAALIAIARRELPQVDFR